MCVCIYIYNGLVRRARKGGEMCSFVPILQCCLNLLSFQCSRSTKVSLSLSGLLAEACLGNSLQLLSLWECIFAPFVSNACRRVWRPYILFLSICGNSWQVPCYWILPCYGLKFVKPDLDWITDRACLSMAQKLLESSGWDRGLRLLN